MSPPYPQTGPREAHSLQTDTWTPCPTLPIGELPLQVSVLLEDRRSGGTPRQDPDPAGAHALSCLRSAQVWSPLRRPYLGSPARLPPTSVPPQHSQTPAAQNLASTSPGTVEGCPVRIRGCEILSSVTHSPHSGLNSPPSAQLAAVLTPPQPLVKLSVRLECPGN